MNKVKLTNVAKISGTRVEKFEGERNYLDTGNLKSDRIEKLESVNYKEKPSRANQNVEIDDVIFARMKDTVKVLKITDGLKDIILSTGYCILKPNKEKIDPIYLEFYLKSEYFNKQKNSLSTGATQVAINNEKIKQITIPLYDIEKQRKIADELEKIQSIINVNKRQLENFYEIVKSRFVEMFGDPFSNPKEWDVVQLKDIIINANNGIARRGKENKGEIVLRLVELQDGYIDYSNVNRIELTDKERQKYLLKDNDFLFARVNGNPCYVGRCTVFKTINEPTYHNDHIIRVHFDEEMLEGNFISYLLNSDYGKKELRGQIKTSAGQYTISQDGIGVIKAIVPPIELQNQFKKFVEQVDKLKFETKKLLEELQKLQTTLVNKYFN